MPPPTTRSSSPRPSVKRPATAPVRLCPTAAGADWRGEALTATPLKRESEFHSAHAGHWPCHLGDSPPQALHTKTVWVRAIAIIPPLLIRGLHRALAKQPPHGAAQG